MPNRLDFYLVRFVNLQTGKMHEKILSEVGLELLKGKPVAQILSYQYDHTYDYAVNKKFQKSFF
jgi:hypothetical protein